VLADHAAQRGWLLSIADPHEEPALAQRQARQALLRAEAALREPPGPPQPEPSAASVGPSPEAAMAPREFHAMVARALEHIRAGDIFQANLSQRFTARWEHPALRLHEALRRINPSPFAAFLSWDALSVVSCSPERLVRVEDGRADTRPIAGTRPRGATQDEDAFNGLDLLLSDKERAEHIMLVDLARNDLGRVCVAGSVSVGELMALEEYSHVIHIVSDVSGALRPGADAADVIRAMFPGGTVTGCPKVRCMEIIRELEPVARGLYTGSLGYLAFDGTMDLNIAIRTMVIRDGRLAFHVGAGIVADSDPEREYHETLAKAGALLAALRAGGTAVHAMC
jgi:anthranilate/para-aminobenzoate synthase component I